MKYGYARVSTYDQKTALQLLAALKKAGCRHIFTDTASGVVPCYRVDTRRSAAG